MKLRRAFALLLATFAVVGCDQGRDAPQRTAIAVMNAAPGFRGLQFTRGQPTRTNQPTGLSFQGSFATQWDVDTYNIRLTLPALSGGTEQFWESTQTIEANTHYVFVLTQNGTAAETVVIQYPAPSSSDTNTLIAATNASTTPVDLYLEPEGAGIIGAAPRATIGFQELPPQFNVAPGKYEITLTEAGNPANVLLASAAIEFTAAQPATIVVTPEGNGGTEDFSVMVLRAEARSVLYDRNATAELRVINAATDRQPRDFAIADQFTPPLFSAIPFAEPTAYAPVAIADTQNINVTPVGDPGVLELNSKLTATAAGHRYTLLFTGTAGTLLWTATEDDLRRFPDEAKLRFYNAAPQFSVVDLFVMAPDTTPETTVAVQTAQLASPGMSTFLSLRPGEYDLYFYLTLASTPSKLAGPVRVSVAGGGLYGVMSANGADSATAEMLFFDDFLSP